MSTNEPNGATAISTRSFYRRPLPSSCTPLSSSKGRSLFSSASSRNGLKSFFPLVEQHLTQIEPAYCGISTLVIILNALSVDPRRTWKGPWRWYEESMLNCCIDLEQAKQTGITFSTFVCLATCQGLTVESHYASDASVDRFRDAVKEACITSPSFSDDDPRIFLVVSYNRKTIGQTGTGHFSPVAAYDDTSDSVLILDTARFKYGAHWLPLHLLFEAMLPIDPDTDKSRGYVLFSHHDDEETSSLLPMSILFRSKQSQDWTRRDYKSYLSKLKHSPVRPEDVIAFWTKDNTDVHRIWSMLSPQLCPVDQLEIRKVDQVLSLIRSMIQKVPQFHLPSSSPSNCTAKKCGRKECGCELKACNNISQARRIKMKPSEAIFVTYLASLSVRERKELVYEDVENGDNDDDDDEEGLESAHKQLLAEAELIQIAIEMSDQHN